MKTRINFLLSLLVVLLVSSSCTSQIEEPDMNAMEFQVELSGVTVSGGVIYALESDTIIFAVASANSVGLNTLTYRESQYFVDGTPVRSKNMDPHVRFAGDDAVGNHTFSVAATLVRDDSSLMGMCFNIPVKVVGDSSELPSHAPELGCHTYTIRTKK